MKDCEPCLLASFAKQPVTRVTLQPANSGGADQAFQAQELYKPVKPWQTRLLELKAGEDGDVLLASLITVDIIQAEGVAIHDEGRLVHYEALSYTWGPPEFSRSIVIDGHAYPITANLAHALLRLRDANCQRLLWVDALCINQHDAEERSTQVARMMSIYGKAKRVLVWLGEHGEHTAMCLRFFEQKDDEKLRFSEKRMLEQSCQAHASCMFKGLMDIVSRPWCSRVWVRQEIWAARAVLVVCGNDSFRLSLLSRVTDVAKLFAERLGNLTDTETISRCRKYLHRLQSADAFAQAVVADARLLGSAQPIEVGGSKPTDVVSVIRRSNMCGCTDSRDRVYGVLGMTTVASISALRAERHSLSNSNSRKDFYLRIDYKRSTARVFRDLTVWILSTEQNLSLLLLVGSFGGTVDGEALPSWCPNWNEPFGFGSYAAPASVSWPSKDSVHAQGDVLPIEAVELGRVGVINIRHDEPDVVDTIERFASIEESGAAPNHGDHRDIQVDCDFEVIGAVSSGDIVLKARRCSQALIVRQTTQDAYTYQGWIDASRTESDRRRMERLRLKPESFMYQTFKLV